MPASRRQRRRAARRNTSAMDIDANNNCTSKSRIQTIVDMKTDAEGNLAMNLSATNLRTGSEVLKALDLQYQEFKPLGLRIRVVLDMGTSTSNDYAWSTLRAYHYNVGSVKPARPECLPSKLLQGTTTVVHIYGSYSRRWYGSTGTIEGGLFIRGTTLPKMASIGKCEIDFSIAHR